MTRSPLRQDLFKRRYMPDLYRRFQVRQFRGPSIVWINDRFWRARGHVLDTQAERDALEIILLDRFGVTVPSDHEADTFFKGRSRWMYADRYGGPLGTVHGGSGRGAAYRGLHAKGIGVTPLCSTEADWYHSHGCMWLEEAVREAILSELADREFPRGSSVVAAVIDTGHSIFWPDGTTGERRAIVVRGSSFRVAYLERSIYFGSSGVEGSDQHLDAQRVRQAVGELERRPEVSKKCWKTGLDVARHLVSMVTDQVAFGHVHRMTHGDYYSSNIDLDGRLLDFGSFRSLPDWRRAEVSLNAAPFGEEGRNLIASLKSIHFFIKKYGTALDCETVGLQDVDQLVMRSITDLRRRHFIEALGEPASGSLQNTLLDSLLTEFERQQQTFRNITSCSAQERADHWLFGGLMGRNQGSSTEESWKAGMHLRSLIEQARDNVTGDCIARWAMSRRWIERERLQDLIMSTQSQFKPEPTATMTDANARALRRLIQKVIARSIRYFKHRPYNEVVEGCFTIRGTSVILKLHNETRRRMIALECQKDNDTVFLFGKPMYLSDIENLGVITDTFQGSLVLNLDVKQLSVLRRFSRTEVFGVMYPFFDRRRRVDFQPAHFMCE